MHSSQELINNIVDTINKQYAADPAFASLTIPQLIDAVEKLQMGYLQQLKIQKASIRRIDAAQLAKLYDHVNAEQGGRFILRHGEQDPGSQIDSLNDETSKKIAMMQSPHNEQDPIRISSAIEYIGTLMIILYIKSRTRYQPIIESSSNLRAKQPADALGQILKTDVSYPSKWQCVNYRDNAFLDVTLLDKGTVPWQEKNIDTVVKAGAFAEINQNMLQIKNQPTPLACLELDFTHTQQTQSLCQQSNLPVQRLGNYGFIYQPRDPLKPMIIFENGFYQKEELNIANIMTESQKPVSVFFDADKNTSKGISQDPNTTVSTSQHKK